MNSLWPLDLLAAIALGFAPAFLTCLLVYRDFSRTLVASMALGFIPLAILQVLAKLAGDSWLPVFALADVALVVGLAIMARRRGVTAGIGKGDLVRLGIGVGIGVAYFLVAFGPKAFADTYYVDLLWNASHIGQLKQGLVVVDSQYYTGVPYEYYYLAHRAAAALSLLSGTDAVTEAGKVLPLLSCVALGVIVSSRAFNRRAAWAGFAFFVLLALRFSASWGPEMSFVAQITGFAGTTFFWSLPLLVAGATLWNEYDAERRAMITCGVLDLRRIASGAALMGLLVAVSVYAKATAAFAFLALEAASALSAIPALTKARKARLAVWTAVSYAAMPLAFIMAKLVFFPVGDAGSRMRLHLERADFADLGGQVWAVGFVVLGVMTAWGIVGKRLRDRSFWLFATAAAVNAAFFLLFSDPGTSDRYFLFNAFILVAAGIARAVDRALLPRALIALGATAALSAAMSGFAGTAVNPLGEGIKVLGLTMDQNIRLDPREWADLRSLRKSIGPGDVIAYPYPEDPSYRLSAMLEAIFLNESSTYSLVAQNYANSSRFDAVGFAALERSGFRSENLERLVFGGASLKSLEKGFADVYSKATCILVLRSDISRLDEYAKSLARTEGDIWCLLRKPAQGEAPR